MAVKKKATRKKTAARKKSTSVARRKSTAVATSNFEERMAEMARSSSDRVASHGGGANIMSIRGGKFTMDGENLGTELSVVVLEYGYSREYYDGAFDPDNPMPPACFSLSLDANKLEAPHADSPNAQADTCADCDQNEWGSSGYGQSKACGSKVTLAIADADSLEDPDYKHATVKIGVNSMINWDNYVEGLSAKLNRPPFGVVTRMFFDEDSTNPILKFELDRIIESEPLLEAIFERVDNGDIGRELEKPKWDLSQYEEPAARTPARKKAARKKKAGRRSKFSS